MKATNTMATEIMIKVFDLINNNNYYSISDENYNYEEGDTDEPIDWFEVFDEIVNCKKITDMVDYKGYIEVDYVDDGKDCIFIIEYIDDEYQTKLIELEKENKKLKNMLHKALELGDTLGLGKFEEEDVRTIDSFKSLNQKLRGLIKETFKAKSLAN